MRIWPEKTVDQEFADLAAAGHFGSLNDRQFSYLRSRGFTGALADMMFQWRVSGGPDLFAFAFYNEAGNTTITTFDALRVSINGGAWQTLAAAGLTVSQASNGELRVSGFTGSETSVRYHIEHEQPGEPFNIEGTVSGIYVRAAAGAFPANTSLPGIPVAATIFDAPVEATA